MVQTGDVILKKEGGPISKAIQLYTKSEYSHAALSLGNRIIIHSHLFPGVHMTTIDNFNFEYDIYKFDPPLTEKETIILKFKALDYVGKKYDLTQIIGYLFFGLKGENHFNSPRKIICSELIDRLAMEIDRNILPEKKLGDITPDDLAESDELKYYKTYTP
ncbi:MAG: YiiX/YebB-like N1pC/P60 family cysteine hydrolase [archaeon]